MNWGRIMGYGMLGVVSAGVYWFHIVTEIFSLFLIAAMILFLRSITVVGYEVFKGIKIKVRKKNDNLWL